MTTTSPPLRHSPIPNPYELLWAILGTLLTVMGTLMQLSLPETWTVGVGPLQLAGYTFSLQGMGMLIAAFIGGTRSACWSQLAYLVLGVLGYNVFLQGGGASYVLSPAFGYLLGFLPGAWLCGRLVPRDRRAAPQELLFAGLMGLLLVHVTGISFMLTQMDTIPLWSSLLQFSVYPLLGQLLVLLGSVFLGLVLQVVLLVGD